MKEKIIIHQKIPKPTKIVYKQFKSIINMTTLRTIQKQTMIIKNNQLAKILSKQKPQTNTIMKKKKNISSNLSNRKYN